MYDSLYAEGNNDVTPADANSAEKRQLLKKERDNRRSYDDEDDRGSPSYT